MLMRPETPPFSALLAFVLLFCPAGIVTCAVGRAYAASDLPTLITADGERMPAELISIGADGNFTFGTDGSRKTYAADQICRWGALREPRKGPLVLLADGGLLVGDVVDVDDQRLLLASDLWAEVSLPIELVRGIVFWPPMDRLQRDRLLDRIAKFEGQADRILLENGDLVEGAFTGLSDKIVMEVAASQTQIPIDRVTALTFDPSLLTVPRIDERHILAGFRDGTRVQALQLVAAAGAITVKLPGGISLTSAPDIDAVSELTFLMSFGPQVIYVSDLKPLGHKHIPYLDMSWGFGIDRNVLGGRLRGGGHAYAKGVGMHSTARLVCPLDRAYRWFEAELAVDDAAAHGGSVIFRVLRTGTDGQWQDVYRSPIVRGGDQPIPIKVDLSGATHLVLIVEFADRADQLDYANWLDARLVP